MTEKSTTDIKLDKSILWAIKAGNYVSGYTASLVYVMNGLARVVLVTDKLPMKNKKILSTNCKLSSVPFLKISKFDRKYTPISNLSFQEDVCTIVDDSFKWNALIRIH